MSASDTSASGGGKQSSILLLTPSLELARAFLLRSPPPPLYLLDPFRGLIELAADDDLSLAIIPKSGFYEHCQLSLPPDVRPPTSSPISSSTPAPSPSSSPSSKGLQWTSDLPWSIENKYYSASVRFVLRQLGEEGPGPVEEDDGEGSDEDGEDGYPAVLVLLDSSPVNVRIYRLSDLSLVNREL